MTEPRPTEWFAEWFDRDYLMVYGHRDARDARLGVDLLLRVVAPAPGDRVLDLACGPGRHAVPLAEHGLRAVGLDLSQVLLGEAHRFCARLPLVRGDMRRIPFLDAAFPLVASFFTSFGYFDEAGNREVLDEVRRVLAPAGRLFLDYLNRDQVLATLAPEASRRLGSTYVIESRSYDAATRRLIKEIEIQDGSETRRRRESVRLYGKDELLTLLAAAGIEPQHTFGSLAGDPFDPATSPRLVVVGVKR